MPAHAIDSIPFSVQTPSWKVYLVSVGLLLVAVVILFVPALVLMVSGTDYQPHLDDVHWLLEGAPLDVFIHIRPHFLFHLLVAGVITVFPAASLFGAGLAVALTAYMVSALLLYAVCVLAVGRPENLQTGLIYTAVAVVIMLVAPISLLTPGNLYFGYIPITVYHNPTVSLLRPLALTLFMLVLVLIKTNLLHRLMPLVIVSGMVTALTTLAKPNFTVAFLPALVLLSIYKLRHWQWQKSAALMVCLVFPGVVILYAQTAFFSGTEGLTIAPFAVMKAWLNIFYPDSWLGLLPRFLLSILFPAYVYIAYRQRAVREAGLNLAWVTFGFGAIYTYLVAEAGERLTDGNWTWSGQITLFVLFAFSAVYWMRQKPVIASDNRVGKSSLRWWLGLLFLGLHVASGLMWYNVHVNPALLKDALQYYY